MRVYVQSSPITNSNKDRLADHTHLLNGLLYYKYHMVIEQTIKLGDQLADDSRFEEAIVKYLEALNERPDAFTPLIKRAHVFIKIRKYESAKSDINKALLLAEKRGKMHEKALCHLRLGLAVYGEKNYKDAISHFREAQRLKCSDQTLPIWLNKAERDLKKQGDLEKVSKSVGDTQPSSSSIDVINKHAPLKVKIRDDWYQDNDNVTITIYAKNIEKNQVHTDFTPNSVLISFPSSGNSEYHFNLDPLFGIIDEAMSSFKVYATKIELTLKKLTPGKWTSLEGSETSFIAENKAEKGLSYPSSSKRAIDWSSFKVNDDAEESEDFFAKLYKDVDEDTRRAMMKSYVESNGTVLTTDWSEAKLKTFETSPPEGMEVKKW